MKMSRFWTALLAVLALALSACTGGGENTSSEASPSASASATPEIGPDDKPEAAEGVEILETSEGWPYAVSSTNGLDAFLATTTYACGGDTGAAWLSGKEPFSGKDLAAAYAERPAYAADDQKFWSTQFAPFGGAKLFSWLVDNAQGAPLKADKGADEMTRFARSLVGKPLKAPRVYENFTCKGDVVARNGFLEVGTGSHMTTIAGLVVSQDALVRFLAEQGKTLGDLYEVVDIFPLGDKDGAPNRNVLVAFKAAGCFNNLLKPAVYPEVPGHTVPQKPAKPTQPPATTPPGGSNPPPSTPPDGTPPPEEPPALTPKAPGQDPAPRGNAPVGGGQNQDPGPGTYVPPQEMVQPPAAPRENPPAPAPAPPAPAPSDSDPNPIRPAEPAPTELPAPVPVEPNPDPITEDPAPGPDW